MNLEEGFEFIDEEYVTLEMEDGSVLECVVLAIFPVDDKQYIALYPEGEVDEENEGVYLYEYVENEDEESELLSIEDDEVYEKVIVAFEEFMDKLEDEHVHDENCGCH